ncbi:hypothetical protein HN588_03605 [Candidatus Bathyarchaeota archaeon]|jgi:hypothetical protein|nr:hypothetical protein [Candidatus Bathyarchaeota archaeon]
MNSNTYSLGRASANTQLPLRRIRGLGFANAFGVRQLEDVKGTWEETAFLQYNI